MPRDSLVGSSRRCSAARELSSRAASKNNLHRIERPPCLENPNRPWAQYSQPQNAFSPFSTEPKQFAACRYAGQDSILRPVFNRPLAAVQHTLKSADEIGAQLEKLPHNCTDYCSLDP